jgi:hypothetical protein
VKLRHMQNVVRRRMDFGDAIRLTLVRSAYWRHRKKRFG